MPTRKTLPPQHHLQACFTYDPETGEFRWRERPREHFNKDTEHRRWNTRYAGTVAGRLDNRGRRAVGIDGLFYQAHRLIWKLMTNEEPQEIDHRDVDPTNNRWSNLRVATHSQNAINRPIGPHSKTGFKGVYFDGRKNKFGARIQVDNKMHSLGHYDTAQQAHGAYCEAAQRFFGGFWHP